MTDLKAFSARAPAKHKHMDINSKPSQSLPLLSGWKCGFSTHHDQALSCWGPLLFLFHLLHMAGTENEDKIWNNGGKNQMLKKIEKGFSLLHNEAWSFCLWCHCKEEIQAFVTWLLIILTYNSIIFCYSSKKKNLMFWLNAASLLIMELIQVCIHVCLPQGCGDYICFDAGFKRIKCDTTQHLQNKSINRT